MFTDHFNIICRYCYIILIRHLAIFLLFSAFVGSFSIGMTFLMSPLAGILTERIGIRITALIGSLIAFSGMMISSFFIKLNVLYITYGLMVGAGSSLAYTPSLAILGHYFKRRLGLVNGLVTTGSAVFTIIYPPMLKICLEKFGLSVSMQILAGFLGVMCLGSFAYKPLLHHQPNHLKNYVTSLTSVTNLQDTISGFRSFLSRTLNYRIWRNKNYVMWIIGVHVAVYGYFVPFVHLVSF